MTVATFGSVSLERLARLDAGEATLEAAAWLKQLVADDYFLESQVLPLFDQLDAGHETSMAVLADGGGAYSLLAFHWPVGSATPIHDHGSWAVLSVAIGCLREERFQRLDVGSQSDHPHLRRLSFHDREPGQVSTLMPHDGGIHRIQNLSSEWAISIHLYGPSSGLDGQDFDPAIAHSDDHR